MSDETAIKITDLLEVDREEVLIAAAIARSDGAVKEAWMNVSKRAGIAAFITLTLLLRQWELAQAENELFFNILYIMRNP